MRVALVHDWLTGMRGGERCLEVFCELFPEADLFTLLHVPGSVHPTIEGRRVVTSFVQRLPWSRTHYRRYLPLFPAAVASFDLRGYDLILSSSHCVAKAVHAPPGALHVCYCYTPMRYVWDLYEDYAGRADALTQAAMPVVAAALRRWDRASSRRVHQFVAISRYVADRIRRHYRREADVIHPPVDLERFAGEADGAPRAPGDFYLVVSALVPYKRVDLAIDATTALGRPLVVVGTGPEERRLRARAGPGVQFLGWRPDDEIARLYRACRAVIFPGIEDFGIVPLEALAAGRPVIAYRAGGVLETMIGLDEDEARATAVFFDVQSVDGLVAAMRRFEREASRFSPAVLRARAAEFERAAFKARFAAYLDRRLESAVRC